MIGLIPQTHLWPVLVPLPLPRARPPLPTSTRVLRPRPVLVSAGISDYADSNESSYRPKVRDFADSYATWMWESSEFAGSVLKTYF